MRRTLHVFALVAVFCSWAIAQQSNQANVGTQAQTVVPRLIRFTGQVKDAKGTVGITFSLHKGPQDSESLWIETQNAQLDATGKYTVLLGATTSEGIPAELFTSGEAQWLGIQVQGQPEQPRVLLVSVPYALRAAEADTLAGHAPNEFVTTDKLNTAVQQQLQQQRATTVLQKTAGPVGLAVPVDGPTDFNGTTTNQIVLVTQTGTGAGLVATAGNNYALSGTSTNTAIYGTSNGATHSTAAAIEGLTTSTSGRGIFGYASSASGYNFGLSGQSNSISGTGIFATATASSGKTIGLETEVNSPSGTAAVFQNRGGGKLISGQTGSGVTEVFSVSGTGLGSFAGAGTNAFLGDMGCIGANSAGVAFAAPSNCQNYAVLGYGGDLMLNRPTGGALHFRENNGEQMTLAPASLGGGVSVYGPFYASGGITTPGPVGIATSAAPAATLEVNGTTQVDGGATFLGGVGIGGAPTNVSYPLEVMTGWGKFDDGFISDSSYIEASQGNTGLALSATEGTYGWSVIQGLTIDMTPNPNPSTGLIVTTNCCAGIGVNSDETDAIALNAGAVSGSQAGYFFGSVNIDGNLSKSGGSFKIDDPLDPAGKYLYHSFVESPDMMNVYNGNIVTDGRGFATVMLPQYFETLNRDFRYQLTVIGDFAQAVVAKEVENNQFLIKTNKPKVKVSWQVTGIRQDAWANAHRIPEEIEKPAREKGYYLHPELFGAPEEKGMRWAVSPELARTFKAAHDRSVKAKADAAQGIVPKTMVKQPAAKAIVAKEKK